MPPCVGRTVSTVVWPSCWLLTIQRGFEYRVQSMRLWELTTVSSAASLDTTLLAMPLWSKSVTCRRTVGQDSSVTVPLCAACLPARPPARPPARAPAHTLTHLDIPVIVHQQVWALEVPVHDGRLAGVQVQHAPGGAQRLQRGRHRAHSALLMCCAVSLQTASRCSLGARFGGQSNWLCCCRWRAPCAGGSSR